MAVKDHTLDSKIVEAAKAEFMLHGFRKASLKKISERAGITTGALYTRYKNKDDLFCSLIADSFSGLKEKMTPLRTDYQAAQFSGSAEQILQVIRSEEKMFLDLLFDYYDECVLFFCKSDGSSIENALHGMMEKKSKETVAYLKSIAKVEIDYDGIEMIMTESAHYYRSILEKGYDKEKAVSCMETVYRFLEAGWKELFEKIL